MRCKKCDSSDIRTRTNYTHGSKSKAMVSGICRKCGSTEIQKNEVRRFRRGR